MPYEPFNLTPEQKRERDARLAAQKKAAQPTEQGSGNAKPATAGKQTTQGETSTKTTSTTSQLNKPVIQGEPITAPTITPIKVQEGTDTTAQTVGNVAASRVHAIEGTAVGSATPEGLVAEVGAPITTSLPSRVSASQYQATQVRPDSARVEAAKTQYKPDVQAAIAETPQDALVSHQMQELTAGLESGNIPTWAQGAVAAVDAQLAARGMSRSSIGRADLTNAILQSALPIAQQNAQTVQQTSLQNLQNKQRTNELNAQLKTNVELANLSNEQQARLSNQTSQQAILLSNQAADNAGKQFNAQSQNQINTFMANLKTQVEQFNTAQTNAMTQSNTAQINAVNATNVQNQLQNQQFNAAQNNAMEQFNQQLASNLQKFSADQAMKADMFNKQNQLAISQSNVEWRRQLASKETAILHETNMTNTQMKFQLTQSQLANFWQVMRDRATWAWQSSENALGRETQLLINTQDNAATKEAAKTAAKAAKEAANSEAIGAVVGAGTRWLLQS